MVDVIRSQTRRQADKTTRGLSADKSRILARALYSASTAKYIPLPYKLRLCACACARAQGLVWSGEAKIWDGRLWMDVCLAGGRNLEFTGIRASGIYMDKRTKRL